jgi:hypothetical protein
MQISSESVVVLKDPDLRDHSVVSVSECRSNSRSSVDHDAC